MIKSLATEPWVEKALGRKAYAPTLDRNDFAHEQILITGGLGSIGLALVDAFESVNIEAIPVDTDEMDVTDPVQVACVMDILKPTLIFHLAGAKHAPEGEADPMTCVSVNTTGTQNVIEHAPHGARIVTASTCKACDPETAYGASKLLAERLTLNAGHGVARFHNVVETSGNVFELWRSLPRDAPVPVTGCTRYFISSSEAVGLLLHAALSSPARWIMGQAGERWMPDVSRDMYPDREIQAIAPRRGDREVEPLMAANEWIAQNDGAYLRVHNTHDRQAVPA